MFPTSLTLIRLPSVKYFSNPLDVLLNLIKNKSFLGSWHIGKSPDRRALETMKKHDLAYSNKARQIKSQDFKKFDYIFGMDNENMDELADLNPKDGTAKLLLLGDFDPKGEKIIRDPYYDSGSDGFEKAYVQSVRCCEAFLKKVLAGEVWAHNVKSEISDKNSNWIKIVVPFKFQSFALKFF